MKIGIMQPYFMPYIGYWQLMNLVDKYVIFDDVNFINRGWINRNRILVNGVPRYINIQLKEASQNKRICDIDCANNEVAITKNLRMLELSYKRAPYFSQVYSLLEDILTFPEKKLNIFLLNSIQRTADYLGIHPQFILSSKVQKNNELKGQEKILDICRILGATEYYNAIGGKNLYEQKRFKENGIKLKFLQSNEIKYKQFNCEFIKDLSIIDIMMFNSRDEIQKHFLQEYLLVD